MVGTNKIFIRIALIISYLMVLFIIIFLISSVYTYFNTGAERSKMIHVELNKENIYSPVVNWKENGNEGRKINKQTLQEVEKDYLNAWYVKNSALRTYSFNGIKDYYTESARKNLFKIISENKNKNIIIKATTLSHEPDILFFSEDGQMVVLEDKNVIEYKEIIEENISILTTKEVSNYKIILLLEDGFWRIRHLIKEQSKEFKEPLYKSEIKNLNIKGINYYPKDAPWNMYGNKFNANTIENDFKIIHKAGLNTVRIFVPYLDFGKAKVELEKLNKLEEILNIAEKTNLKVIITLFDFYGNYDIKDWTLNFKHAKTIVEKFKNHKAILAWDLKNEPDLDFDSRGKENVIAWLSNLSDVVKNIDKKNLITIGWSNANDAIILQNKVDFISFHFYNSAKEFEDSYNQLINNVNNKAIVLGEFGKSSYRGIWNAFGSSEEAQANYFKEMQKVLTKRNISFMSWTLYDFETVPKEVVGSLPWRMQPQKKYGFINSEGNKKPSFKYISK